MSDAKPKKGAKQADFQSAQSLFANYQLEDKGGYITREFQDYGYRLAVELDDLKHKALYICMAKKRRQSFIRKSQVICTRCQRKK